MGSEDRFEMRDAVRGDRERPTMVVADLEGTLTTGTTWRALGHYLLAHGRALAYVGFVLRHLPLLFAMKLWPKRRRVWQSIWMRDLLGLFRGLSCAEFAQVAAWVVEKELWPRRRREVVAALRAHQLAGEEILLASGVYQPVLEHFARKLGAQALGTPIEIREGHLTGRLADEVQVGEIKALRLHERLGAARLYAAYGDTEADIPMLMLSDRPIAVYPDQTLRDTARALGWTVLESHVSAAREHGVGSTVS